MIQYITKNQLDIAKYDSCISHAINTRIYAYSWYLDSVCDDWDALVKDDYHMVMPLPKRRKLGISYIYQAPWIQQLGIFSDEIVKEPTILQFIQAIPKKFKLIDVFFNANNQFSSKYTSIRDNYILSLTTDFTTLKNNYNKNRKRASKIKFDDFVIDKKGNTNEFINLYKEQSGTYKSHKDALEKLRRLINNKKYCNIWNVYNNHKIIAGLCWFKDAHRITYLVPVATSEAKKENIPTYIVNELIKTYQNTNYTLDFEGSMVEGVAKFYKSFGAQKEEYYWYKRKVFRV